MLAKAGASLVNSATAGAWRLCTMKAQSCFTWRLPARGSQREQQTLEVERDLPCQGGPPATAMRGRLRRGVCCVQPYRRRCAARAGATRARSRPPSCARTPTATSTAMSPRTRCRCARAPGAVRPGLWGQALQPPRMGFGRGQRVLLAEGQPNCQWCAHVYCSSDGDGCARLAPSRAGMGITHLSAAELVAREQPLCRAHAWGRHAGGRMRAGAGRVDAG